MTKPILGIDLGTTNATAAYVDDHGQIVLIDIDGKPVLPSVVQNKGEKTAAYDDLHTATRSAEILKVIKAKAEAQLCRTVDECVITCPAYYNAVEIENTQGRMLGSEGLIEILRSQNYPQSPLRMEALEEELLRYSNSIRLEDDLTIIELRLKNNKEE